MTDTREKLEADIRKLYTHSTSTLMYPPSANKTTDYIKSVSVDTVLGWLDRQSAITERECLVQSVQGADAILTAENAELQARLEKSHRDWLVDAGEYEQVADGMKKQIAELQAECEARGRALESNLKRIHELEANSMPLPLDADGVPIRVGDTVEYSDGYEMWTMRVGMIGRECVEECESGVIAKICHHVKRDDPLVELAIDLISDGFLADVPRSEWDVRATEVARLIREALKVVGE